MTDASDRFCTAVRPAVAADILALAALRPAPDAAAYFAACLARQEKGERSALLAEAGGAVAGWAMLNFTPRYALYSRLGIPEIQDLYVGGAFRRRGIGVALIAACEDLARARGHGQIGISVGLHAGFGAAQRLYVRRGYVPDGFGVTYDRNPVGAGEVRPVDDDLCLMMVKDL